MNKKKFIKMAEKVGDVRDFIITLGTTSFGCLGFIFGGFAIIYIILEAGQEVPKFILWLFSAFGFWIGITLLLMFINLGMIAIARNKKNWRKTK
ncbi:MAG: hypothetical protein KAJ49_05925 [Arcobacteraceae bacterium]|nr:hypothetical protein [Arcobacteraceae bacterium]